MRPPNSRLAVLKGPTLPTSEVKANDQPARALGFKVHRVEGLWDLGVYRV